MVLLLHSRLPAVRLVMRMAYCHNNNLLSANDVCNEMWEYRTVDSAIAAFSLSPQHRVVGDAQATDLLTSNPGGSLNRRDGQRHLSLACGSDAVCPRLSQSCCLPAHGTIDASDIFCYPNTTGGEPRASSLHTPLNGKVTVKHNTNRRSRGVLRHPRIG